MDLLKVAQSILQIDGVSVNYGPVTALRDISASVGQGQIVALLGSNGAGKSTLMRSLIGLTRSSSGTMTFDGTRIDNLAVVDRVQLGIASVLEGRGMLPRMSVLENLKMGAYTRPPAQTDGDIEKVLEMFPNLRSRLGQLAGTLSGGEQQMLAFGRALMLRPRLILMDEPSMGLAPVIVEKMFDAIEAINSDGVTVMLVEQNARMALSVADKFYVISNGSIVLAGWVQEGELFVEGDGEPVQISEDELEAAYLEGR